MVAYMVSLTISCQLAALLLLLVLGACEFSSFDSDNEVVIAPALVSIAQDQVTGSGNGKRCFTTAAVACPARPHPSPFPCPLSAYRLQPASVGGVMTARYATDDAAAVRDEHASTVAVEDSTLLSGRSSGYGPAENWNEQQEEHQQKRHLHNSPSPSHPVDRPGRPASGSMLLWRCWLAALVLTSISPGVLSSANDSTPNVPDYEIAALHDFYVSTGGDSWEWYDDDGAGNEWNFSVPDPNPCADSWQGITCSETPSAAGYLHVLVLCLIDYSLDGPIPSSLGNLTELQVLSISQNYLWGSIPATLGQCTQLAELYIYDSQLTGSIPDSLGQCTGLMNIDLSGNQLTGSLPPALGNCTQLTFLNLNTNQLAGSLPYTLRQLLELSVLDVDENLLTGRIPDTLGQCAQLTDLLLYKNRLTGLIPDTLGQCAQLVDLSLHDNRLTGSIPDSLGQCTGLINIDLSDNQLTGSLPPALGNCTQLTFLNLYTNKLAGSLPYTLGQLLELSVLDVDENLLTGRIPDTLGQCVQLTYLLLYKNRLTGLIPDTLGQCAQLIELSLHDNRLTGSIPHTLGQCKSLEVVHLSYNYLTGSVPDTLGNCTQLQQFDSKDNLLTGSLPDTLGQCAQLTDLLLYKNRLTGPIPDTLGQCAQLIELSLHDNRLTGSIPHTLGQCKSLEVLYLSYNYLTGSIPDTLGNCTQLQQFDSSDNQLTDNIPDTLGNFTQLRELYMNDNLFTGTIPNSLTECTFLSEVSFSVNYLTGTIPVFSSGQCAELNHFTLNYNLLVGTIPSAFGQCAQLTIFSLHDNLLTGTIPSTLGQCTLLTQLYLQNNQLTGSIPASLGQCTHLGWLYLFSNYLTGGIPNSLGQCTQLKLLLLNDNKLNGSIPDIAGRWTPLIELHLNANDLTGSIPASLGQCTQLSVIILNDNKLSGSIPRALGNCTKLSSLFLQDNQLTGSIPDSLGQCDLLYLANLANNHLSGRLPGFWFSSWNNSLHYLDCSDNMLTGFIPAVQGDKLPFQLLALGNNLLSGSITSSLVGALQGLYAFYANDNLFTGSLPQNWTAPAESIKALFLQSNRLTGSLPDSLGHLPLLQSLNLSSNRLTGTIPTSFQQLGALQSLLLKGNQLRGSVAQLFSPSGAQSNLSVLQLSDNQLTGTLPVAAFLLPRLSSFAAVDNCLEGPLPEDAICGSTTLRSLVLDGLHSASACSNHLASVQSSKSKRFVLGTLPQCLFSMANLTTLHLSGSGLTGSLPTGTNISAALTDLSLSHNLLTGKIPASFLGRNWDNFDLSYNRLTGTLSSARDAPYGNTTELNLQHNRLSGVIPGSMQQVGTLFLLQSNLFSCRVDRSDLPSQDPESSKYTCGSDAVNGALYAWLGLLLAVAVAVGVVRYFGFGRAAAGVQSWLDATRNVQLPSLLDVLNTIDKLVLLSAMLAAYCIVVLLPVYAVVDTYHPVFTYQYAWTVSGAYLSGTTAFALDAIFLLGLLPLMVGVLAEKLSVCRVVMTPQSPQGSVELNSPADAADRNRFQGLLATAGLMGLTLSVVVGINVAFVFATLNISGRALSVIQILLAVFKLSFNSIVAPALKRRADKILAKEGGRPVRQIGALDLLQVLLNVIAIPCLVVAFISPTCFYDALKGSNAVTSSYDYTGQCSDFLVHFSSAGQITSAQCTQTDTNVDQTSYTPPFTYSYQCSSSFVTYYAPTYVIMCIISGFLVPAQRWLLLWLRRNLKPGSHLHSLVIIATPRILKELPSVEALAKSRSDPLQRPVFHARQLVLSLLTYLALLLTFGALFPPLAVCCAVAMASVALTARLEAGFYLTTATAEGRKDCVEDLERTCADVAPPQQLRVALDMVLAVSCMFMTLFLFDTLGDVVGFADALWVLIVVPVVPLLALSLRSVLQRLWRLVVGLPDCGVTATANTTVTSAATGAAVGLDPELGVELQECPSPAGLGEAGPAPSAASTPPVGVSISPLHTS